MFEKKGRESKLCSFSELKVVSGEFPYPPLNIHPDLTGLGFRTKCSRIAR
jgi:hypothetical protein